MDPSNGFVASSSPLASSTGGDTTTSSQRKSRFTYRQLAQLSQYSTSSPLRVVAHVDLDAFYAQCESIRLGLPEDQPLAVQQWAGLIAVNYPARDSGITRFLDIGKAKELCPNIVLQHVATWKEGDSKWQYHPDAFDRIATHKVSLDPYRSQSRAILACIRSSLPAPPLQKVEKASVDEVFLDLSAHVHSILLERYPELKEASRRDSPHENLPRPSTTVLDWKTDALIDLDEGHTEDDDPDWDDVALCIASEIVRHVRQQVRKQLKFTCSAGVAKNKMLAKLGSAHKKPNSQTVVRNRAVRQFLGGFKFTKIRNLGGKLGEQVVTKFGTEQVDELRKIPLEQLKQQLDDDTASWLHALIRGEEGSEVNSRTQIKSMLSAKSFRPTIFGREQAERWLRIFVADIFSRLVEEGVLEHKRRPKTLTLHHRQGGQTWSRQIAIPPGTAMSEELLFSLSQALLQQIILEGHVWPCSNLSLSVTGFEEGPSGNRGIGGFLVKGDEAKNANLTAMREGNVEAASEPPAKKRRTEAAGIQTFFKRDSNHGDVYRSSNTPSPGSNATGRHSSGASSANGAEGDDSLVMLPADILEPQPLAAPWGEHVEHWICPKCGAPMLPDVKAEHDDWHFAKELMETDRLQERPPVATSSHLERQKTATRRGRPPNTSTQKSEKGQMRLAFGKG